MKNKSNGRKQELDNSIVSNSLTPSAKPLLNCLLVFCSANRDRRWNDDTEGHHRGAVLGDVLHTDDCVSRGDLPRPSLHLLQSQQNGQ